MLMDLFPDLIRLLRPQATRWGTIRAAGRWGVSFPERHDLLFFRVDRGNCLLLQPGTGPLPLAPRDVVLVRTSTPFALASDQSTRAVDSWARVAATRSTEMHVGEGAGKRVVVRGGCFVFGTGDAKLLTSWFPPLVRVAAGGASSDRVRTLLAISEAEAVDPEPGSGFISAQLTELLLAELFRGGVSAARPPQTGLLAGLADPVTARALAALHGDVARPWTTAGLARLCGCSRSGFSQRFARVVGTAPMSYLRRWRLAIAKDELRRGRHSIAEIALLVGFRSGSAFSTAFTRAAGCSPRHYAEAT